MTAVQIGDSRELVVAEDLTRTQIVQYAGASGDYNPLHSDNKFTTEVAGYPGVFASRVMWGAALLPERIRVDRLPEHLSDGRRNVLGPHVVALGEGRACGLGHVRHGQPPRGAGEVSPARGRDPRHDLPGDAAGRIAGVEY